MFGGQVVTSGVGFDMTISFTLQSLPRSTPIRTPQVSSLVRTLGCPVVKPPGRFCVFRLGAECFTQPRVLKRGLTESDCLALQSSHPRGQMLCHPALSQGGGWDDFWEGVFYSRLV